MRASLAPSAGDAVLRHGYTLSQVSALSVFAVKRQLWHQAADFDERLEVAYIRPLSTTTSEDYAPNRRRCTGPRRHVRQHRRLGGCCNYACGLR